MYWLNYLWLLLHWSLGHGQEFSKHLQAFKLKKTKKTCLYKLWNAKVETKTAQPIDKHKIIYTKKQKSCILKSCDGASGCAPYLTASLFLGISTVVSSCQQLRSGLLPAMNWTQKSDPKWLPVSLIGGKFTSTVRNQSCPGSLQEQLLFLQSGSGCLTRCHGYISGAGNNVCQQSSIQNA